MWLDETLAPPRGSHPQQTMESTVGRCSVAGARAALLVILAVVSARAQVGPRRLVLGASSSTIPVGQTQNLTVSARFFRASGATPFNGKVRWFSSNSTVATVAAGKVTASATIRGAVTITAVSGPATGSITLVV